MTNKQLNAWTGAVCGFLADSKLFFVFLLAFLDLYFLVFVFVSSVTEVQCFLPSHTTPKDHPQGRDHPLSETRIMTLS